MQGENRYIESICQTLFSTQNLLQVLTQRDVESHKKRPFVKYLMNVYMKTMEPAEHTLSASLSAAAAGQQQEQSAVPKTSTSTPATPAHTNTSSPAIDSQAAHGAAEFPHEKLLWDFIELLRDEARQLVEYLAGADYQTVYYMLFNQYPQRFL